MAAQTGIKPQPEVGSRRKRRKSWQAGGCGKPIDDVRRRRTVARPGFRDVNLSRVKLCKAYVGQLLAPGPRNNCVIPRLSLQMPSSSLTYATKPKFAPQRMQKPFCASSLRKFVVAANWTHERSAGRSERLGFERNRYLNETRACIHSRRAASAQAPVMDTFCHVEMVEEPGNAG